VKEEEDQQLAIREAQSNQVPLVTRIIHLKYARASGQLNAMGRGSSGGGGNSGGGGGRQLRRRRCLAAARCVR
jgi:uncharacterized membrane protein YgcG